MSCAMDPANTAPPLWRRPPWRQMLRHATTLLLIGLYCAIVAPIVATILMALRANGLTLNLPAALVLTPLAILLAGPAAFLFGLVFGWMLLILAANGINHLAARTSLAILIASIVWWLTDPLPNQLPGESYSPASDWSIWTGSAAITALMFRRNWVKNRITMNDE